MHHTCHAAKRNKTKCENQSKSLWLSVLRVLFRMTLVKNASRLRRGALFCKPTSSRLYYKSHFLSPSGHGKSSFSHRRAPILALLPAFVGQKYCFCLQCRAYFHFWAKKTLKIVFRFPYIPNIPNQAWLFHENFKTFSKFCFLPSVRSIILNQHKPSIGPPKRQETESFRLFFLVRIAHLFLRCLFIRFLCHQWHLKSVAKLCVWSTKCLPCDFRPHQTGKLVHIAYPATITIPKTDFVSHIVAVFLHFLKKCFPPSMGSIIL